MKRLLLPLMLLWASNCFAAPSFVQIMNSNNYDSPWNTSPPTIVNSFSATPTVGHLIACSAYISSPTLANTEGATVTDNQGNSYTQAITATISSGLGDGTASIYIFYAISNTSSGTFTVTFHGTNANDVTDDASLICSEYSGISTTTPAIGLTNSGNGSGTTPSPGAINSSIANTLYYSIAFNENSGAFSANNSFNLRYGSGGYSAVSDLVGTGSQTGSFTASSATWIAAAATFYPPILSTAVTINNATVNNATIN